jgi:predicted ATPase
MGSTGMVCLTLEGEPGIGKTRLLLAIEQLAQAHGSAALAVTADEEIRGPFLVARGIFTSPVAVETAKDSPAEIALRRVCDALSSVDDPSLDSLAPDQKLVRVFDLAAVALRTLTAQRPLAILVDDLQWADEDSIRPIRYAVRTLGSSPIVLVLASRSDEIAFVNEAVTLLADTERMGLLRRLKIGRFTQLESTEFLRQVLGGDINLPSAAAMHAQAEGVPFILAEQVSAYRDAGMIQQIDGAWTLARNAEKLLPSAVRTVIQRRTAHLPEETKTTLAEAAILGRTFSLRDVHDAKARLDGMTLDSQKLTEALAPAVAAGLLIQHPQDSAADYSFYHDRLREYAADTLLQARRRSIHRAIVQMLMAGGEPTPESLPLIAYHALAAERSDLCAEVSVAAARSALEAHAPEEVLRLCEQAQTGRHRLTGPHGPAPAARRRTDHAEAPRTAAPIPRATLGPRGSHRDIRGHGHAPARGAVRKNRCIVEGRRHSSRTPRKAGIADAPH